MKIGIMDSGMGGLSVLYEARKKLPNADYLYFADVKNVPYGTKDKEEIKKLTDDAVNFLYSKNIDALVIACNTATSAAVDYIRDKYQDLIVIGMEPAVKLALDNFKDKKTLVIATPLTIKGDKMSELVAKYDKNNLINLKALPFLVTAAENNDFDSNEVLSYLKTSFKDIDFNEYSSIVLGCTHFNYFKETLRNILPEDIKILDGNNGTINRLISELKKNNKFEIDKKGNVEYYFSKEKVHDLTSIDRFNEQLERVFNL